MASLQPATLLPPDAVEGQAIKLSALEDLSIIHVKGHRLPDVSFVPDAEPGREENGLIWLGPNERLLINHPTPDLSADVYVTDVSHQFVALNIEGEHLTRLIETGTAAFPTSPGGATRLRFGDVTAITRRIGMQQAQLIVDASIAPWLWHWLIDRVEQLGL